MNTADKVLLLKQFTDDDLKAELQRRKVLERARRHLPSAEEALRRAQEKVNLYKTTLAQDETRDRLAGKRALAEEEERKPRKGWDEGRPPRR